MLKRASRYFSRVVVSFQVLLWRQGSANANVLVLNMGSELHNDIHEGDLAYLDILEPLIIIPSIQVLGQSTPTS